MTSAVTGDTLPETALQVALTADGMGELGFSATPGQQAAEWAAWVAR